MLIEIDTQRPQADDGPVLTFRFDETAMTEIRGTLAERGNDEIRAIFDDAQCVDVIRRERDTGETFETPEGDERPIIVIDEIPAYAVTFPQAARKPFVTILRDLGAGDVADELDAILTA